MSKKDKFREIFKIGSAVAKPFVPGAVGSVLEGVNEALEKRGPTNAEPALKLIAKVNDEQTADIEELTQAILALHERVKRLEAK